MSSYDTVLNIYQYSAFNYKSSKKNEWWYYFIIYIIYYRYTDFFKYIYIYHVPFMYSFFLQNFGNTVIGIHTHTIKYAIIYWRYTMENLEDIPQCIEIYYGLWNLLELYTIYIMINVYNYRWRIIISKLVKSLNNND